MRASDTRLIPVCSRDESWRRWVLSARVYVCVCFFFLFARVCFGRSRVYTRRNGVSRARMFDEKFKRY